MRNYRLSNGQTRATNRPKLGIGKSGLSIVIARTPEKEEQIIERRLAEFHTGMVANLETIRAAAT